MFDLAAMTLVPIHLCPYYLQRLLKVLSHLVYQFKLLSVVVVKATHTYDNIAPRVHVMLIIGLGQLRECVHTVHSTGQIPLINLTLCRHVCVCECVCKRRFRSVWSV